VAKPHIYEVLIRPCSLRAETAPNLFDRCRGSATYDDWNCEVPTSCAPRSHHGSRLLPQGGWSELAKGVFGYPNWSKDGEYVYVRDSRGKGALLRIRVSDRKFERLVKFENFSPVGSYGPALTLTSDDAPLLLRDARTQDVYALDWEEP